MMKLLKALIWSNIMHIAVIGAGTIKGEQGGAESFYKGLVSALQDIDVTPELLCPISDESNFESIKEAYLTFYDLDLSDFDGVISTKAPAYIIRHPNHICYLQHTMRVFYDMFQVEFPYRSDELLEQCKFIQALDTAALQFPRTRKVFAIGNEVKNRLLKYNRVESTVLYQGLLTNNFKEGSFDYIFMPGRIHRWKRVDLIIESMRFVKSPIDLIISGIGEDENKFKRLAKGDSRIKFLGRLSDEELVVYYSNALCVPFVPIREDFGLITIEAFKSGKPVITCFDSGEPAYLVKDNDTGFICYPNPRDIAEKIDYLYMHSDIAREMGQKGKLSIQHISWKSTAERLLTSLTN
jgi:glycosyltransferase involved in cell wall biosynthesis